MKRIKKPILNDMSCSYISFANKTFGNKSFPVRRCTSIIIIMSNSRRPNEMISSPFAIFPLVKYFSITSQLQTPGRNDQPVSKWSSTTSTDNTNSAIDKYKNESTNKVEEFKDRSGVFTTPKELCDTAQSEFSSLESKEEMDALKDKLIAKEKSDSAKLLEELREDWDEIEEKIERSRIMNEEGVNKTASNTEYFYKDRVKDVQDQLKTRVEAIEEAYDGVMRTKDPNYDGSSDEMSSVASWESSEKSKESKDGNNVDSKQSSNKESKDGNIEDSKQSSNQEFKQDSSGVVDDGTNMTEYGWGSGNED